MLNNIVAGIVIIASLLVIGIFRYKQSMNTANNLVYKMKRNKKPDESPEFPEKSGKD